MKICHLADTHLGFDPNHPRRAASGLTERQEDVIRTFGQAIDKIIQIRPELCIHAGDIFDTVRPLNSIIAVAAEQLHRLASEHGIPTVIITGNHDAPKQPHIGAALDILRKIDNLYVASSGRLERFQIGEASIFALPHCLTKEIQKEELAKCIPDPSSKCNLLVMHGVAAGMPEFAMAELGEQELPLDVMDRFDYTALGHFHNHCQVAPGAWYAGSTERLSQSERAVEKGFIEVDLDPFKLTFHAVDAREVVDLAVIDATGKRGDELAAEINAAIDKAGIENKIVRLKVANLSEETIKTMPTQTINAQKKKAFSLNISMSRAKEDGDTLQFGRSGIGRLDQSFLEFLEQVDLTGFDKERIQKEATRYFAALDE